MSDSSFHIGAWAMLALSAFLAISALFSDAVRQRRRKRRRCPKCWYDLDHTQGLRCSECGHLARHERALHKSRRRWKLAMVAAVFMCGSHVLRSTPAIKAGGWPAAIPTTLIIASLAWLSPDLHVVEAYTSYSVNPTPKQVSWRSMVFLDLLDRVSVEERLWTWQRSFCDFMCRWQSSDEFAWDCVWESLHDQMLGSVRYANGATLEWHEEPSTDGTIKLVTRPTWPAGATMYAAVDATTVARPEFRWDLRFTAGPREPGLHGFKYEPPPMLVCGTGMRPWNDGLIQLGRPKGDGPFEYDMEVHARSFSSLGISRWRAVRNEKLSLPSSVADDARARLSPVRDSGLDTALRNALTPTLTNEWLDGGPTVGLRLVSSENAYRLADALSAFPGTTFAFAAEVLDNETVIASGQAWHAWDSAESGVCPSVTWLQLHVRDTSAWNKLDATAELKLRLRGNHDVALRNFEATSYWDGEITLPLSVDLK